jgi:hypothetical protein
VAEPVCDVTAPYVVPLLRKVLDIYLKERRSADEFFGVFARRVTGAGLKALLGEFKPDTDPVNERNQSYGAIFKESTAPVQKKSSQ